MQRLKQGFPASPNLSIHYSYPEREIKDPYDKKITFLNAFQEADDVLRKGVQSICE
jgi:hypothetical protein